MLNFKLVSKHIQPLLPLPTGMRPEGKLKANVRCILFDVYGTLFVSGSGDISIARRKSRQNKELKSLLLKYNIPQDPETVLTQFFTTIEKRHEAGRAKGVDVPEVEIDRIWMQVLGNDDIEVMRSFAVEFELMVNPLYPMPNLEKTLAACRQTGVLMGIVSNAQFYTPHLFGWLLGSDLHDLGFHPNLTFFSYQYGYAKPSLFMFRLASEKLKHMGILPQAVLYTGNDMLNDIYPAQKAGFQTALFAGDARSLRLRKDDPKCKNLSADLVITGLEQVLDHMG